jgi:hypothetical protein
MDFAAALQTLSDTSVQLQVTSVLFLKLCGSALILLTQAYVPQGDTPIKAPVTLPASLKRFKDEKEVLAAARISGLLSKAAGSPAASTKSPRTPLCERNMNQMAVDN